MTRPTPSSETVDQPATNRNGALTLRRARGADAGPAGVICHAAFKTIAEQHGFPPDFPNPEAAIGLMEHIVSRSDIESVVAEIDGRLVGSNFLWTEEAVAGVGPITVDPSVQNNRIGRSLMEAVLEHARGHRIAAVRLVQAAYHGRSLSLYTRLGFDVREPLSLMQGPALNLRMDGCAVRPATAADLDEANALCRLVHGHTRARELRAALERGTATVVERAGLLTGYTTGIGFLGHAVGRTLHDLQALIGAASSFGGPGFLLPTRNAALMRWCLARGLRIVQPMSLMTTGPYQEPDGAYLPSVLF
jgi:GNAT superfamily N-acetyltransferase